VSGNTPPSLFLSYTSFEHNSMQSVRIAPAERGDVVVDFSKFNLGERIYLFNRLEQKNGRGPTGELLAPGTPLLRFDIERDVANDPSQVPASLRPLPTFKTAEAVKRRTWKFDRNNGQWAINNMLYDPDVARAAVKRGTAEIWEFTNGGGWFHPVHIHFEESRILSRNGKAPPKHEQGRKDMFVVAPGETVRIFIRFRDFVGKYVMHCHNTVHEDHAMMLRFDIVP
jgi:FtsP/CotA-like multicopper oxidase with cupredoxin domain